MRRWWFIRQDTRMNVVKRIAKGGLDLFEKKCGAVLHPVPKPYAQCLMQT